MGEVGIESQIRRAGWRPNCFMSWGSFVMTINGETFEFGEITWDAKRAGEEVAEGFARGLVSPGLSGAELAAARMFIGKAGLRVLRRLRKRCAGRHTRWIEEGRARR